MKIFEPFKLKNMVLKNRIVMPPMCIDFSDENGNANDFHLVHYVNRAIGGVGLIIVEATAVAPNGRAAENDLGIWKDEHIEGLEKIVKRCKKFGAKVALQLAHAGRKCELPDCIPVAPSPIRFHDNFRIPKELTREEISGLIGDFRKAAERAEKAGFDAIEIHAAHGYLIHEFLSPASNTRRDEYGGSIENRLRFLKDILKAVHEVWPEEKPVFIRISASDYIEYGLNVYEMADMINIIKDYVDIVHVSSGGLVIIPLDVYAGYQVKFCEIIKERCSIPTIAVGLITTSQQAEEILKNERADLVSLGRELLRNPYWVLETAYANGIEIEMPVQYKRAFRLIK